MRDTLRPSCRAIENPPLEFRAGGVAGPSAEELVPGSFSGAIVPGPSGDAGAGGGSDETAS